MQTATVAMPEVANPDDTAQQDAVQTLRDELPGTLKGTDLTAGVTGSAAQSLDERESSERAGTLVAVGTVVLLLAIFRSTIIALLPVVLIGLISPMATGLIASANDVFDMKADRSIQELLTVVLFGIGTDYILFLLLRSLVAPWYLMVSVALGFGATLGATSLIFQLIGTQPGLMFMLPVIMYLFVVALGTDYNILMVSRLREEVREGRDPRDAAGTAVRHSGPIIAAAGVILAGTFATLILAGNATLSQMGFALSFGIAVASFVMAMIFTPSLTALIGHTAWWPGHGDRGPGRSADPGEPAARARRERAPNSPPRPPDA